MCLYYKWLCYRCHATNTVVSRCPPKHNSPSPTCPQSGDPPSMPLDGYVQQCQQCQHWTSHGPLPVHAKQQPPPPVQQPLRPRVYATRPKEEPGGLGNSYFAFQHDDFWLKPATRLPDAKERSAAYNHQRSQVFVRAEQDRVRRSGNGEHFVPSTAWEEAWVQLQEALRKQ